VLKLAKRLLVVSALIAIGFGAWIFFGFDHSIANGSQIFAQISMARAAIPANASHVHVSSSAASWIGGCSQIPGARSGWTTDYVGMSFRDADSRAVVIEKINHTLQREGWRRHDASPGRHEGRLAHWTLSVRSGHRAQAWAFPQGPTRHLWAFTASWTPPGPRGQGCP
jgi:hypothetical protein